MHLQVSIEPAVEIANVGQLALLGTPKGNEISGTTTVTFLLTYKGDAPLTQYFNPRSGFQTGSFLQSIFTRRNCETLRSVTNSNQHYLVFTVEVSGKIRDARKLLHAIGDKIYADLCELEDWDKTALELEDQVHWAQTHRRHKGPMPEFERKRCGGEVAHGSLRVEVESAVA